MISMIEKALVTVIGDALNYFSQNTTTLVPQIFSQETSEAQSEISTWWSKPNNQIIVKYGFSLQPVRMPQITVTIDQSEEMDPKFIDSMAALNGDGSTTRQTWFSSTFICSCYGINQNWVLWAQMLCRWALLVQRKNLEESYGLMNQSLSLSPFVPFTQEIKDAIFPFTRHIYIRGQHMDSWQDITLSPVFETNKVLIIATD